MGDSSGAPTDKKLGRAGMGGAGKLKDKHKMNGLVGRDGKPGRGTAGSPARSRRAGGSALPGQCWGFLLTRAKQKGKQRDRREGDIPEVPGRQQRMTRDVPTSLLCACGHSMACPGLGASGHHSRC